MILFVNVKITSNFMTYYERGLLPASERADVFRYAMASLAVIPWSAVRLYVEFDPTQEQHRDAVMADIERLFPSAKIAARRLAYQHEWRQAVEELEALDDKLVWFLCNDDHVFIDSGLDTVLGIEQHMLRLMETNPYVACPFSHWPEHIAVFSQRDYRLEDGHMLAPYANTASVQIVTKAILRHWWFSTDYGDVEMPRTDWHTQANIAYPQPGLGVLPLREMVRHFDGYSHVGIDLDICPPLSIPPGFFDKTMRLQYGGALRPDTVLIDPLNRHSAAADATGACFPVTPDRTPLFWRQALSETTIGRQPGREDVLAAEAARFKLAASMIFDDDIGIFTFARLMSQAGLPQPFSASELSSIQGDLNQSRNRVLLARKFPAKRIAPYCDAAALAVIVEDHRHELTEKYGCPDFSSAQAGGVEVLWLATKRHVLSPRLFAAMEEAAFEHSSAEILLWLPTGHHATVRESLTWAAQLSSATCESIIDFAMANYELILVVKADADIELDIGAKLIGIAARRQAARRLLTQTSGDANTHTWERLIYAAESKPDQVKVIAAIPHL